MTVISCERAKGTSAGQDQQFHSSVEWNFIVRTDDNLEPEANVQVAPGYLIGFPHPNYSFLVVTSVTSSHLDDSGYYWNVRVGFGPRNPPDQTQNPLEAPPEFSCDIEFERVVKEVDINGKPYLNAAGDKLFGVERNEVISVSRIKKNMAGVVNVPFITAYTNTVNESEYSGAAAKTLLLGITGNSQYNEFLDGYYTAYVFEFRYKPDGWNPRKLLNIGDMKLVGGDVNKKVNVTDKMNNPTTVPQLLDFNGDQLAVGAAATFVSFKDYEETDFEELGLGL